MSAAEDQANTLVATDYKDPPIAGVPEDMEYIVRRLTLTECAISREDLIGTLDDGAAYRLIATVNDSLGQSDTAFLPTISWTVRYGNVFRTLKRHGTAEEACRTRELL